MKKKDQPSKWCPMLWKNHYNKLMTEDRQKKQKKPVDDGSIVDAAAAKKPIGDGLIITTVATMTAVILFGLRLVGVRQGNALLTPTSLAWFMSLPVSEL